MQEKNKLYDDEMQDESEQEKNFVPRKNMPYKPSVMLTLIFACEDHREEFMEDNDIILKEKNKRIGYERRKYSPNLVYLAPTHNR